MDYKDLLNKLIEKGQEKMDEVEAFLVKNKQLDIEIYKGEIDKYSLAESGGLSFRGSSQGRWDIPTLKGWKNLLWIV